MLSYQVVKIATGTSLSGEADLRSKRLVGIQMPAAWDAAALTFACRAASDAERNAPATYDQVNDSGGTELSVTAAAARYIVPTAAHQAAFAGLARLKVRSGTAGAAVNQTADRFIVLVLQSQEANS